MSDSCPAVEKDFKRLTSFTLIYILSSSTINTYCYIMERKLNKSFIIYWPLFSIIVTFSLQVFSGLYFRPVEFIVLEEIVNLFGTNKSTQCMLVSCSSFSHFIISF